MEHFIFWLPFICVVLHIFEEFVWPSGFLAWHRIYQPEIATSITPRFAVIGNVILLIAAIMLGIMGPAWSRSLSLWLILAALVAGNAAFFHIMGALRTRRYSPGIVTGVLLYLPLCVWGYWHFIGNHEASIQFALVSFAIGASYQLWSTRIHRGLVIHKSSATTK